MKKILFLIVFLLVIGTIAIGQASTEKEWFDKGVAHLKQEQYDAAVDAFTQLIVLAPDNPHAYKNRGVAHMKKNQYDQAIADFEKTLEIVPDLKGIYSNLGVAWYYKGNFVKSIENYNKEIEQSPESHFALFNRAICRAEIREYEKSLEDVASSLALEPRFYLAHCLKGDLHLKLEQPEKARTAYETAVGLDPDQPYAREQLDRVNTLLQAVAQAASPAAAPPKNPDVVEMAILPRPRKNAIAPAAPVAVKSPPSAQAVEEAKAKSAQAKPAAATIAGPAKGFALQVGAFKVKANAAKMKQRVDKKGFKARILVLTKTSGDVWHLVRLGEYPDRHQAKSAKVAFQKTSGMDALVRPIGGF